MGVFRSHPPNMQNSRKIVKKWCILVASHRKNMYISVILYWIYKFLGNKFWCVMNSDDVRDFDVERQQQLIADHLCFISHHLIIFMNYLGVFDREGGRSRRRWGGQSWRRRWMGYEDRVELTWKCRKRVWPKNLMGWGDGFQGGITSALKLSGYITK